MLRMKTVLLWRPTGTLILSKLKLPLFFHRLWKWYQALLPHSFSMADLRTMGDTVKSKLDCGVVVLAGEADGKITFLAMATPEAVKKGVHAGNIIREITKIAGGSGGGKPDMAQGGGKDSAKIDNALAAVDEIIASQVKE